MFHILKSASVFAISLFAVTASAGGHTTVVKDVPSYNQAVGEACTGSSVGAQCTITFQGGSVSIGVCVSVPGPAGGILTCQIDPASIPSCKNNAVGTPGSSMVFAVLALGLYLWRRKQFV